MDLKGPLILLFDGVPADSPNTLACPDPRRVVGASRKTSPPEVSSLRICKKDLSRLQKSWNVQMIAVEGEENSLEPKPNRERLRLEQPQLK